MKTINGPSIRWALSALPFASEGSHFSVPELIEYVRTFRIQCRMRWIWWGNSLVLVCAYGYQDRKRRYRIYLASEDPLAGQIIKANVKL